MVTILSKSSTLASNNIGRYTEQSKAKALCWDRSTRYLLHTPRSPPNHKFLFACHCCFRTLVRGRSEDRCAMPSVLWGKDARPFAAMLLRSPSLGRYTLLYGVTSGNHYRAVYNQPIHCAIQFAVCLLIDWIGWRVEGYEVPLVDLFSASKINHSIYHISRGFICMGKQNRRRMHTTWLLKRRGIKYPCHALLQNYHNGGHGRTDSAKLVGIPDKSLPSAFEGTCFPISYQGNTPNREAIHGLM